MERLSRGDGEAQKALCEALGLDASKTRSVVIEMRANSVALMCVTQFLTETQVAGLNRTVRQYAYTVKELPCYVDTDPKG